MSRQRTQRAQTIVRTAVVVVAAADPLGLAGAGRRSHARRRQGHPVAPAAAGAVARRRRGVGDPRAGKARWSRRGQLLLKIDETRATSGVRESAAQGFALRARQARLRALAEGTAFLPPASGGDDEKRASSTEERRLYETRLSELNTMLSINRQQLQQRQQELTEMRARRASAERSLDLGQQELAKTRPLLASGAVSEVDILRLERDVARSRGESEQAGAQIARVQAAIGEAQRKIQETELTFRNEARKELAEVMGKLNALNEGAVALADKVDKSQVKSPVRGRVQRLLANTVGGVVQPGKDIVEIVPLDDALVLEARVQPQGHRLHPPGPGRHGEVHRLRLLDLRRPGRRGGEHQPRHRGRRDAATPSTWCACAPRAPSFNDKLPIIPGMTAEVDILTGNKTVMSYLLKPVLKAKAYALRER